MDNIDNKRDTIEHHEALEKTHHSSKRLGFITILLLFGLFGIWSIFANIATTVTANGKVITTTYNKIVTHPTGGLIKKIYVKEGDIVKKNQKLLELDSVKYSADLQSNISQYDTNLYKMCRLEATSKLEDELDCSSYKKDIKDRNISSRLESESREMFLSDLSNFKSKISLLEIKNRIYISQNDGLKREIESNKRLLTSYEKELKKWKKLLKQDAVDELKSIETQRRIEQVKQQIGTIESKIEENLATIKANEAQIIFEKNQYKNKAIMSLNDLRLDNKQIESRIEILQNNLANSTIKSPSDGKVADMKLHAAGEAIPPYKPILTIVPDSKDIKIEALVLLTDIEKVFVGESVEISFASFVDPGALPIAGEITYVSADAFVPDGARESFYKVLIKITPAGFEAIKKNEFNILPGMPATAFIKTGETTLMRYLIQPFILLSKGIFNAN